MEVTSKAFREIEDEICETVKRMAQSSIEPGQAERIALSLFDMAEKTCRLVGKGPADEINALKHLSAKDIQRRVCRRVA